MSEKALRVARFVLRIGVAVVAVIVAVIGLGVLLRLLNANPEAGFTDWVYGNQDVFMTPFENVFDPVELGEEGNVVDVSGLLAMAVYACLWIPLGLALGWVRRSRLAIDQRRKDEAEAARQARVFGRKAEAPTTSSRRGVRERLRRAERDGEVEEAGEQER